MAGGGVRKATLPKEEDAREAAAEGGAHLGLHKQLQKFQPVVRLDEASAVVKPQRERFLLLLDFA